MPHFAAHTEIDSFIHSLRIHWVLTGCKQSPVVGNVLGPRAMGFCMTNPCENYRTAYTDKGVLFDAKKK